MARNAALDGGGDFGKIIVAVLDGFPGSPDESARLVRAFEFLRSCHGPPAGRISEVRLYDLTSRVKHYRARRPTRLCKIRRRRRRLEGALQNLQHALRPD
jgi:hypothetical protein